MKQAGYTWTGLIIIVGMILFCRCSPYAGKSVLHFFFDGVPETDSIAIPGSDSVPVTPDSNTSSEVILAMSEPDTYIHYPYGERECASCHNEQALGNMIEPQPGLCYGCHEDLGTRFSYLHGPVAGGYCTACHDPHTALNAKLLKRTGEALCFYCHQDKSVLANEVHEDLDGMPCMDCHNPHGGEDKYIFQ